MSEDLRLAFLGAASERDGHLEAERSILWIKASIEEGTQSDEDAGGGWHPDTGVV